MALGWWGSADGEPALLTITTDGKLIVAFEDMLRGYDLNAVSTTAREMQPRRSIEVSTFPDPATDLLQLVVELPHAVNARLTVYDILGREVMRLSDQYFPAWQERVTISVSDLASGRYFYRVDTGLSVETGSFVVAR